MKTSDSAATACTLLVFYVTIVIIGTVLLAGAYTVHALCRTLVAGQPLTNFNARYFIHGLFLAAPLMLIAIGPLLIFYLIRHSSRSWLPLCLYGLLYLVATWGVLLPLSFRLTLAHDHPQSDAAAAPTTLSPGYFREVNGRMFYYSSVTTENVAEGACLDLPAATKDVYTFTHEKLPQSSTFSDSLIQASMELTPVMQQVMGLSRALYQMALTAYRGGRATWVTFALMGLAMVSLAGIRHISKWRLINVISITYCAVLIIALNLLCPPVPSVNRLFAKLTFVANPFLALCNLLIFVLFALTGLVIDIRRKARPAPDLFSQAEGDEE